VLQKVLQPLYFAREDTKSPFYYALVALVVNAGLAIGLAPVIGYLAAALGTTLAGWAMVFLLWRGSRAMGEAAATDRRFRDRIWRIVAASLVMGALLFAAARGLSNALEMAFWRYPALALLVATGVVGYFLAAHFLGALRLSDIRRALRR